MIAFSIARSGEYLYITASAPKQKKVLFPTQLKAPRGTFDTKTKKFLPIHPHSLQLNAELTRQLTQLESYALRILYERGTVTLATLRAYVDNFADNDFLAFVKKHIDTNPRTSHAVKKHDRVTLNYLSQYAPETRFSDLSIEYVERFHTFLQTRQLARNTIADHHKRLKKFINAAIRKELLRENPYKEFQIKIEQTDRCILDTDELARIAAHTPATPAATAVRDMFLFSAFTGLRFSDVYGLTAGNFRTRNGQIELHIRARKTSKLLTLPLWLLFDGKPAQLAQRYIAQQTLASLDTRIFEFVQNKNADVANQLANRLLREICFEVGIYRKVTMHVARHTFATIMATKVSTTVLQQLLQHSDINTTLIYIHLSNKHINDELQKINWKD